MPGVTHLYCRPLNLIYLPQLDQDARESSYCRLAGGSLVFEKIELILTLAVLINLKKLLFKLEQPNLALAGPGCVLKMGN